MSIASEISRLSSAKSSIKTAIENKGVTVPSATTLDGYAALINNITTARIGTATVTPSSNSASISFSVSGEPLMFAVHSNADVSLNTTRSFTSIVYDGTNTIAVWGYRSGSSATAYRGAAPTYVTFAYSNGTLTVSSAGSTTKYFRSGIDYKLVYVY